MKQVHAPAPSSGSIICDVLKRHGEMTVYEISGLCSMMAHEVGKRMSELDRFGRATRVFVDGKLLMRPSPRGGNCAVWRAIA
jgi:hypothetical protein